jgi:uncharacterized protein YceK
MNRRLPLLTTLTLITLAGSGCTSIRARTELSPADWTLYPGVRRDVSDLGDAFEGKLNGPGWSPFMVAPILIADLPFSAGLDTLALPYDVNRVASKTEESSGP